MYLVALLIVPILTSKALLALALPDADEWLLGMVAIINFPHPLLQQGLVVVDTPGLNAIGSEPELALRLIPEAHIVLFMLAADTGVTKTDLELWLTHVQPHQHSSALVILNKIDNYVLEYRNV